MLACSARCLKAYLLAALLIFSGESFAQRKLVERLVRAEYRAGHFNGSLLAVEDGRIVAQVQQGFANFQFAAPVTAATRFPIASMTKLFTAILTLQLVERAQLRLEAPVGNYLPDLPADCRGITVAELLTHHSGLKNEPSTQVYQQAYPSDEFVRRFVAKDARRSEPGFNYNNIDYILLTRVLEVVAGQPFAQLVRSRILVPLRMHDSGVVQEERIIPGLAYGYHNYTFGSGSAKDTLRNDARKYLSNYAGAGAMYSTVQDLYKLVQALQANQLLTAATTASFLLKPQRPGFVEEARGYPTAGFYYNDKSFAQPCLERRGSIDGFNSVLLLSPDFRRLVIILTNTDTADLEKLGDRVYGALTDQ